MKQSLFIIITLLFITGCYMNDDSSDKKETTTNEKIETTPQPKQVEANTQGPSSPKYGTIPPAPPVLD